jgi:CrcB protein
VNGLVIVGAAGAVGAVSRHALDVGLRRWFPDGPSIGILVANVVGSFVLGFFTGFAIDRIDRTVSPDARLAIAIGFCGGLTTFSTFMAQLAEEIEGGRRAAALRWAAVMLVAGLVAAAVGVAIGRSL